MLRIIVADDDQNARDKMVRCIDQRKYGIHIVGTASDGAEVCRMIQEQSPDIVLIDIEMPIMSGLQVIDIVYNRYSMSSVVFIIVSSYENFNYAHEAIRLGVNNYLLKPFMPSEICDAIYRAARHIDFMRTLGIPAVSLPGGRATPAVRTGPACGTTPAGASLPLLTGTHIHMNYPFDEEQLIIQSLHAGNAKWVSEALDAFFSRLSAAEGALPPSEGPGTAPHTHPADEDTAVCNCLTILFIEICRFALSHRLKLEALHLPSSELGSRESFRQTLQALADEICRQLSVEKGSSGALQLAVSFIDEHFAQRLTLAQVAAKAFVSPAYLSTLFSRQLNTHFVDYIHKVRIEHSIRLMRENPHLKFYEVSERVGYSSYKHYAKCFKKVMNMTVSQYLSKHSG